MPSTLRNQSISTAQVIRSADGLVGTPRGRCPARWAISRSQRHRRYVAPTASSVHCGIQAKPVLVQMNTRSGVMHSAALSVTGSRGSHDVLGVYTGVPTGPSALRNAHAFLGHRIEWIARRLGRVHRVPTGPSALRNAHAFCGHGIERIARRLSACLRAYRRGRRRYADLGRARIRRAISRSQGRRCYVTPTASSVHPGKVPSTLSNQSISTAQAIRSADGLVGTPRGRCPAR